jgi:xylulose-5-phosphate/fructose-6-phosphate phosphoketolase
MTVLNDLDRFHLVMDVIDRVPGLGTRYAHLKQDMRDMLVEHRQYVCEHGDDLPLVKDWKWKR